MRILRCEPEEIKNPYQPCDVMWGVFEKCKQVVLDQAPDVDLDEMIRQWIRSFNYWPEDGDFILTPAKTPQAFTEYLREQLGKKE